MRQVTIGRVDSWRGTQHGRLDLATRLREVCNAALEGRLMSHNSACPACNSHTTLSAWSCYNTRLKEERVLERSGVERCLRGGSADCRMNDRILLLFFFLSILFVFFFLLFLLLLLVRSLIIANLLLLFTIPLMTCTKASIVRSGLQRVRNFDVCFFKA